MNNLREIGVGYDYVKSGIGVNLFTQVEAWLQLDGASVPALSAALLAAVLISNRLSESKRR